MKKLKLNELKVQSFVTIPILNSETIKGGSNNCNGSENCNGSQNCSGECSGNACSGSIIRENCDTVQSIPIGC